MTVFDDIYLENRWAGVESRSGPGSGSAATRNLTRDLLALVAELQVTSILDIGCGDSWWMPDLPGYLGIDISEEAVRLARIVHPDREYRQADISDLEPRGFGLVIVRDVFQHLPLDDGVAILNEVRRGRHGWLLASTYPGMDNIDIVAGECYTPDLGQPPFSLGPPDRFYFDGWGYEDPDALRDIRKSLGLWRL